MASANLSPGTTLALAFSISLLAHGLVLQGLEPRAHPAATRTFRADKLSVRLPSDRGAPLPPLILESRPAGRDAGRDNVPGIEPSPATAPEVKGPAIGLEERVAPFAPAFEPALYLRAGEVDVAARPVSEEALDLVQLTGNQPGLWVIRLYIGADGAVDELEVVDGRGAPVNTSELVRFLRKVRFTPALARERAVKSQKLLEFSFEPGPIPLMPVLTPPPAPSPSATGK